MVTVVTGLPRSGTAFVSTLLNLHPDCLSYHELASYSRNWRDELMIMRSEYEYVADCNTYGCLAEYAFHTDLKIYIQTPVEYSLRSSEKLLGQSLTDQVEFFSDLLDAGLEWADLVIQREDVFSLNGMQVIWEAVFGDPFPEYKAAQLLKLNVQHHSFRAESFVL